MSFVGIICNSKQEGYIKQIVNINLPNENIIILKEDTIENFKNITFETIAIFWSQEKIFQKKEIITKIIGKAKYLVINADEKIPSDGIKIAKGNVITYGFNTKSTVTASSVREDNMLICIQRMIQNRLEEEIEPQEILIQVPTYNVNSTVIMGIVSIGLIYGKKELMVE